MEYAQFSHAVPGVANASSSSRGLKAIRPRKRLCSVAGCTNGIVQGGVCVKHGAKRRTCKFPGCDKNSKSVGLCSKHGPARKKCDTEGCSNVAVQGGLCKTHGASTKKCTLPGCGKIAALGGYCKRHSALDELPESSSDHQASSSPHHSTPGAGDMSMSQYMSFQMAQANMMYQQAMYMNAMANGNPNFAENPALAQQMMGYPFGGYGMGMMGGVGAAATAAVSGDDSYAKEVPEVKKEADKSAVEKEAEACCGVGGRRA